MAGIPEKSERSCLLQENTLLSCFVLGLPGRLRAARQVGFACDKMVVGAESRSSRCHKIRRAVDFEEHCVQACSRAILSWNATLPWKTSTPARSLRAVALAGTTQSKRFPP